NSNSSMYTLNPVLGVDGSLANEIKLDKNNYFGITSMGIAFHKYDTSGGNDGNYRLFQTPDPQYFNGPITAPGTKKEYECLETIVNGTVRINVSGSEAMPKMAIPSIISHPHSNYLPGANFQLPQWGPSDEERGLRRINPQVILDGNVTNEIEISLANGDRSVIDGSSNVQFANTRNKGVFFLHGFLIKPSTIEGNQCLAK
ncbi:MAG: hypothetical protein ACRC78_04120, partial [Planktothrix sp.]